MAELVLRTKYHDTETYPITQSEILLGRDAKSLLATQLGDFPSVSRRHALIIQREAKFFIEDLGSRLGTSVNRRPIATLTELRHGDRIRLSNVEIEFRHSLVETPSSRQTFSSDGPEVEFGSEDGERLKLASSVPVSLQRTEDLRGKIGAERKLSALLNVLDVISATDDIGQMLQGLLEGLLTIFPTADRGLVGLRRKETGDIRLRATRTRDLNSTATVRMSRTIVERVSQEKTAILCHDVQADANYGASSSLSSFEVRSFMCAPLLSTDGEVMGMIQIETISEQGDFTNDDLELLAAIAPQAALTLKYSELFDQAVKRQVIDRDLEIARRVQMALLPDQSPKLKAYQFFDYYEAAFEVGGDYYDYIPLSENRLAVVLGDAAGKGVSASLLMAKVSGELKYLLSSEESPAAAVAKLNDNICTAGAMGRFVTLVVLVIDTEKHEVTMVNAGHMSPLIKLQNGEVKERGKETRNPAVGIMPMMRFQEMTFNIAPGEIVLVYTDGFTEAINGQEKLYGLERVRAHLEKPDLNAATLGARILDDLTGFVGQQPQSDDMCLVCFSRKKYS